MQKQLGISFVFVTHDQGEALSMADRVAIFNNGKIIQAGSPNDIYERPNSRFVADFVGSSNVLSPAFSKAHGGPETWISLRPEKINVLPGDQRVVNNQSNTEGPITAIHYQGAITRIVIDVKNTRLTATLPAGIKQFHEGETVRFIWSKENIVELEKA